MSLTDLVFDLESEGGLISSIEDAADAFMEYYSDHANPQEQRFAAKVAANRLNVAAYEVNQAALKLRKHVEPEPPAELELGEQAALF